MNLKTYTEEAQKSIFSLIRQEHFTLTKNTEDLIAQKIQGAWEAGRDSQLEKLLLLTNKLYEVAKRARINLEEELEEIRRDIDILRKPANAENKV